jgi:hypothetical protein
MLRCSIAMASPRSVVMFSYLAFKVWLLQITSLNTHVSALGTPYLPIVPLRFTRMLNRTSMVNVRLLLAVSALVCRSFALPTNSTDNADDTRPD